MKKRYVILIVGILLIISGLISSFIISFQNDKKETLKRESKVERIYNDFYNKSTRFNETREDIYNNILNDTYYDLVIENDSIYKNKFSDYELLVDKIEKLAKELKTLCTNVYYSSSSVNNKCSTYSVTYEQINNYFVTDIKLYNEYINKSNTYQRELSNNNVVLGYVTKKEYIDYNNDKDYDGKEDSNNE